VVKRVAARPQPPHVRVVDFGISSYDLAYALLDDYALTVLVDATPRGEAPGTLYLIEPELDASRSWVRRIRGAFDGPHEVLEMVRTMAGAAPGAAGGL